MCYSYDKLLENKEKEKKIKQKRKSIFKGSGRIKARKHEAQDNMQRTKRTRPLKLNNLPPRVILGLWPPLVPSVVTESEGPRRPRKQNKGRDDLSGFNDKKKNLSPNQIKDEISKILIGVSPGSSGTKSTKCSKKNWDVSDRARGDKSEVGT